MGLNGKKIPKLGGRSVNSQESEGKTKTPPKPLTPLQEVQGHARAIWSASLGKRYLWSKQDTVTTESMLDADFGVDDLCNILTTYVSNHDKLVHHSGEPRVSRAFDPSRAEGLLALANGEVNDHTRKILGQSHPTHDIGGGRYDHELLEKLKDMF